MFIFLCYFLQNARRDTAAEKESDMWDDTGHILVQRSKKIKMDKKRNF